MRRTAGNKEIYGQQPGCSIILFGMTAEKAAADRAGSYRNYQPGSWHRRKGFKGCRFHVLCYWAGDDQAIGVPGRCYDFDAKTAEVKNDGRENIYIYFTTIAATGAYLAELKRSAKNLLFRCVRQLDSGLADHEVFAPANGQAWVTGEADCTGGASLSACTTKYAATKIYLQAIFMNNGVSWAGFHA